jgi:hypothetical protein
MRVFVLLFNARTENEGIHTIQAGERNTVLMFESEDDAIRYAGLLEAQDFPTPNVERFDEEEIVEFCRSADYDWQLVPAGQLAIPPELNVEQTDLETGDREEETGLPQSELDRIRSQLEKLL